MRLIKSFGFAINGIKLCSKEPNFKIHLLLALLATMLGFLLHISNIEWLVVLICITLVLAFEMLNTAIEQLCNLISPAFNPVIKIIKDVSAAAVLVVALMAAICGAVIFLPKLLF
ncbi:MAG: diacylglycerol kinase family protein [Ferruginibacter sp.]